MFLQQCCKNYFIIPQTFEEWKYCIVNQCRVNLTKDFANRRLIVYEDSNHPETKIFIRKYGEKHLQNIINWFKKI